MSTGMSKWAQFLTLLFAGVSRRHDLVFGHVKVGERRGLAGKLQVLQFIKSYTRTCNVHNVLRPGLSTIVLPDRLYTDSIVNLNVRRTQLVAIFEF